MTRMLFSSTEASSELSPLPFIFIIFHIGSSKLISPVLSLQCRLVISENFRTRKSYVSSISASVLHTKMTLSPLAAAMDKYRTKYSEKAENMLPFIIALLLHFTNLSMQFRYILFLCPELRKLCSTASVIRSATLFYQRSVPLLVFHKIVFLSRL